MVEAQEGGMHYYMHNGSFYQTGCIHQRFGNIQFAKKSAGAFP
jgi:hypothetical protein